MSLIRKTLLIVIGAVVVSAASIYLASRLTLLQGYEKIEQDDTRANVARVVQSYYNQASRLNPVARGYAYWDEMYRYVQTPTPAFLASLGLTPNLFATQQMDLMAILDEHYQVLFFEMYDPNTHAPLPIPADLSADLRPSSPLFRFAPGSAEVSGLMRLDGRPMYMVAVAALHSDFTGTPKGALVFGRYLDDHEVTLLAQTTKLAVSIYAPEATAPEVAQAAAALSRMPEPGAIFVQDLDEDWVAGYTYLRTLGGQPAAILRVRLPRNIYHQGVTSFSYFTILATLTGAGLIILFMILLRWLVLMPLSRLNRQIGVIRASGDQSLRVVVQGRDELASLASAINDLLQSLETHTRDLQAAKQAVEQHSAQLEAANRELEAFSYSVSHDLRAPLRAINGFSQTLGEVYSASLPAQARHYLNRVQYNAERMGHLIDDLLAFSRLGRQELHVGPLDMQTLVQETLDEFRANGEVGQATLEVAALPPARGDRALVQLVWTNLISNALKYSRKHPAPLVSIGALDQTPVTYYVKDNGVGFDMLYAGKLFGVFQRLHSAEEYEGTGIGLVTVRRILERHGGRVWAEAAVDQGATFYFTLEQDQAPTSPLQASRAP